MLRSIKKREEKKYIISKYIPKGLKNKRKRRNWCQKNVKKLLSFFILLDFKLSFFLKNKLWKTGKIFMFVRKT